MTPNLRTLVKEKTLGTIAILQNGPVRFNEISRRLNLKNPRHLSFHLKKLSRDGIITRTVIQSGPPAIVTYSLTPLGQSLARASVPFVDWLHDHADAVYAARAARRAELAAASFKDENAPA